MAGSGPQAAWQVLGSVPTKADVNDVICGTAADGPLNVRPLFARDSP